MTVRLEIVTTTEGRKAEIGCKQQGAVILLLSIFVFARRYSDCLDVHRFVLGRRLMVLASWFVTIMPFHGLPPVVRLVNGFTRVVVVSLGAVVKIVRWIAQKSE